MNDAIDFIKNYGIYISTQILHDAPCWAKTFELKHFVNRHAKNKRINTWGCQTFKELKRKHIPTKGYISLDCLNILVISMGDKDESKN